MKRAIVFLSVVLLIAVLAGCTRTQVQAASPIVPSQTQNTAPRPAILVQSSTMLPVLIGRSRKETVALMGGKPTGHQVHDFKSYGIGDGTAVCDWTYDNRPANGWYTKVDFRPHYEREVDVPKQANAFQHVEFVEVNSRVKSELRLNDVLPAELLRAKPTAAWTNYSRNLLTEFMVELDFQVEQGLVMVHVDGRNLLQAKNDFEIESGKGGDTYRLNPNNGWRNARFVMMNQVRAPNEPNRLYCHTPVAVP